MSIIGTDVSFYQAVVEQGKPPRYIDFRAMKDGGAKFTIIRAGQNLWGDRDFTRNWQAAKGVLPRGSYWFYDSRVAPKAQAAKWLDMLNGDYGELPLWCDFEERYGGAYAVWKHWYTFIAELLKNGVPQNKIGIYTGYYYWIENTIQKGIPSASLEWFGRFPLWIAAYNDTAPKPPQPWKEWALWQFTDNGDGTKYGVHSLNIDLNVFDGTEAEFYDTFGITNIPETPEESMTTKYQMTVISNGTRLRTDHNVFADYLDVDPNLPDKQSFKAGDVLVGDTFWVAPADGSEVKSGDKWLRVNTCNGVDVPTIGWTAFTHKGLPICKDWKEFEGTPPPPDPEPETPPYQDVNVNVEIKDNAVTVHVNGVKYLPE
jgi:GH25 family lysozyme M1 (1,4-beta-N-acetylmuramidase)